ncbi:Wzz/FepE/Etk N-terminal domain-containing protein [Phocaeicola barnesiae]|uniref:Wzz/FepE/Etk N-terminal domain-containing protein n=1 Tax=Phocaeicola barnesiae TaxID=376804 RepID=A0AAW5N8C5_9BACT|nr:Wzz/FepE/Etk N-terminal domain-containing protein [Phocaeicola barnesiae]MCR8872924.1 Wzz/FepE/Etk N-terminal domain-containing protein [Phocaeicola barnesiae]
MEENKNYTSPIPASNPEEQEIDLMDILRKIIAMRKTLYKAAGIGLVVGIIIAFSIPRQYTVSVTLAPEMGSDSKNSGLASMAASLLGGGNMGNSADALNAALSSEIVSSTPFLLELFDTQVQTLDKELDTTLVAYLDTQRAPWWSLILGAPGKAIGAIKGFFSEKTDTATAFNPFLLTKEENKKVETLRKSIQANIDKKTGITTLSVTLQDAKVTAMVADSVVAKLQQYIINYRIAKAKEDCAYLEQLYKERQQEYYEAQQRYARYVDANKSLVLQSVRTEQERLQNDMNLAYQVYSQVAQQLQVARAKIQEEKPVFAVVEPATVPLQASNSRKMVVIGVFFLALVGTLGWKLFGEPCLQQFKQQS